MSTTQLPLLPDALHHNRQLFSDYYLNVLLPQRPDWQLLAGDATPVMHQIAAIFAHYTPTSNEAQTEDGLIKPVFQALGHTFEVQAALTTPDGTRRPDYIFYKDVATLQSNKGKVLNDQLLQPGLLAVGDAKYWERPLDLALTGTGDPFSNRNPSYQIAWYMQHSGATWGILTNGRLWRLYHKDTAHKLDRFYEVDLPVLLETGRPEAFLYFYAFFHRRAFDEHPLGVTALRQASSDYARGIGNNLKQQVYTALRHLAQGMLDYAPNQLQLDVPTLKLIYDHSLIVLYRLLFILYAEARNLLPVRSNDGYRHTYSLDAIKRDVARALDSHTFVLPDSDTLWTRLLYLFHTINEGSPPLNVVTFNGGLFDPQRYPFLEQYRIGDRRLQQALDMLTRVEGKFVDYRDQAERHLGTIYEGLLEYHLQALPPEEGWTIDLFNDRGERKMTGSYYTPDFVVEYMVDQTLRPLLQTAIADKPTAAAQGDAILSINVLDPSMGSGHFLVAATEYIARFLLELGVTSTNEAQPLASDGPSLPESDLAYWKRRVVQSCIYGVDLNPLAVDLAKLSLWLSTVAHDKPLSFLDHHLRCGNALVGTWLEQLRPLNGSKTPGPKRKKPKTPIADQLSMLDDETFRQSMSLAVDSMWLIEQTAGNTVSEVKEQERLYAALREDLIRKYGRLADLSTATHFGISVDPDLWPPLADYAMGRTLTAPPQFTRWLTAADDMTSVWHFFHWELEFPELFFDKHGQPLEGQAGFDAIIGNPPYVRQESLAPFKPYFATAYAQVYHGVADLYVYFYQQGLRLLRQSGRMAYISSGTFVRANFATPFRKVLPTIAQIETLIDFGENQPFEGAEMVRPSIVVMCKGQQTGPFRSLFIADKIPASLEQALTDQGIDCEPTILQQSEWVFQPATQTRLAAKILGSGRPLIDVVDGQIYRGIVTGFNEAFFIDQSMFDHIVGDDPKSANVIKHIVRGEDIRPWYQEDEERYLIFTRRGIGIDKFPAIKQYLEKFHEWLEPRPVNWTGVGWIGRKPGPYQWYEIQDSIDYYEAFEQPKIIAPKISKLPRFSWDSGGKYVNDTGNIISGSTPFLLGILQSRVLWFSISQICTPLRLRAGLWQYNLFIQFISRLPIPDAPAAEREALGTLAMHITELARSRYQLHQRVRRRIQQDLSTSGIALNQKLMRWWELDFPAFRAQVKQLFKQDIPLKNRDEWEDWLTSQREKHAQCTAEIVQRETTLNAHVYALFDLSSAEIELIETSTKYQYGEV